MSNFKNILEYEGIFTKESLTFSNGVTYAETYDDFEEKLQIEKKLFVTLASGIGDDEEYDVNKSKLDNHPTLKYLIESGKKVRVVVSIEE